jgi:hypothetical protein
VVPEGRLKSVRDLAPPQVQRQGPHYAQQEADNVDVLEPL